MTSLNAKHTPGPWEVRELMGGLSVQARHPMTFGLPNSTGRIVLATPAPHGKDRRAEHEANAHLIAAAPAMYEALRKALVDSGCDGDLCNRQWHEDARAALAQAEG